MQAAARAGGRCRLDFTDVTLVAEDNQCFYTATKTGLSLRVTGWSGGAVGDWAGQGCPLCYRGRARCLQSAVSIVQKFATFSDKLGSGGAEEAVGG